MCYGHFRGFIDEIVNFCREECNPSEEEAHALDALDNYSTDGCELDPGTCRHLFNVITRDGKLAEHFYNTYTSDPFWYTPWGTERRVPVGKVEGAVFGIIATAYDDWKLSGESPNCFRPINNRMTLTRNLNSRGMELCAMAAAPAPVTEKWQEYWKAMDKYYYFINDDDDYTFNFDPETGGTEDAWLNKFVIIISDAAINGKTIHIG